MSEGGRALCHCLLSVHFATLEAPVRCVRLECVGVDMPVVNLDMVILRLQRHGSETTPYGATWRTVDDTNNCDGQHDSECVMCLEVLSVCWLHGVRTVVRALVISFAPSRHRFPPPSSPAKIVLIWAMLESMSSALLAATSVTTLS